jgi:uncharacterized membrane protein
MNKKLQTLCKPALIQGVYYSLTAIWAIVDISSFMAVTGPKTDIWLVKTVGLLILVIGLTLLISKFRNKDLLSPEITFLGIASAASFISIDVYYVAIDRISPVYLADAVAQLLLILLWMITIKIKQN